MCPLCKMPMGGMECRYCGINWEQVKFGAFVFGLAAFGGLLLGLAQL